MKKKIEFHDSGNVHDRAEFHVVSGILVLSSTKHVHDGSDLMMLKIFILGDSVYIPFPLICVALDKALLEISECGNSHTHLTEIHVKFLVL